MIAYVTCRENRAPMSGVVSSPAVSSVLVEDGDVTLQSRPGSGATREVFLCYIFERDLNRNSRRAIIESRRREAGGALASKFGPRVLLLFFFGVAWKLYCGRKGFRSQRQRVGYTSGLVLPSGADSKIYHA
jgi:hypothetical protein